MAITAPGITLAIDALFGNMKPNVDVLRKMGMTDFSAEAPGLDIKPGTTMKVPLSTVTEALAYDATSNNYLTGGSTEYGTLTATHFLQGYDISGVDVDKGVNAPRIKQLFSVRCAGGCSMAMLGVLKTALNGVTASTGVTIPASSALSDYTGMASGCSWLHRELATLVVNGAEWSLIQAAMHAKNLSATKASAAEELGFANVVVLSGMTPRAVIVPAFSMGFLGRVPAIVADYEQAGSQTDPDSGLTLGLVVANDQGHNRKVINGDLWFGAIALSSNAGATTAGIIKVGTAA